MARSALSHESVLAKRDAPVVEEMQALARQYPAMGIDAFRCFSSAQGFVMSADRGVSAVARGGGFRSPGVALDGESPRAGLGLPHPPRPTTYGCTTSSTTAVPTASSSSV